MLKRYGRLELCQVQNKILPIDAQTFSAEAYVNGAAHARCMIFRGGLGSSSKAISFPTKSPATPAA
jgi:hypothetical protein